MFFVNFGQGYPWHIQKKRQDLRRNNDSIGSDYKLNCHCYQHQQLFLIAQVDSLPQINTFLEALINVRRQHQAVDQQWNSLLNVRPTRAAL